MAQLTELAHSLVRSVLRPGDVAIDATVGNGHDTLFLAGCVGPEGIVYGFDIQQEALSATRQRTDSAGFRNVTLFNGSHADLETALPELSTERVRAIMFNLGYLPGGNKRLTTQVDSTIAAIQAGLKLLARGGIITILAYVGHAGGNEEASAVEALLNKLSPVDFDFREETTTSERIAAPRLLVVQRREAADAEEEN